MKNIQVIISSRNVDNISRIKLIEAVTKAYNRIGNPVRIFSETKSHRNLTTAFRGFDIAIILLVRLAGVI